MPTRKRYSIREVREILEYYKTHDTKETARKFNRSRNAIATLVSRFRHYAETGTPEPLAQRALTQPKPKPVSSRNVVVDELLTELAARRAKEYDQVARVLRSYFP